MLTKNSARRPKLVKYIIPSVNSWLKLERHCPHCGRSGVNIHSGIRYRPISDIKVKTVLQRRMKCPFCGTTWTIRTAGVGDGVQRSDRLISIGVVLYMFGLSCRSVEKFLPLLDCRGSKSSVERDISGVGQKARELHFSAPRMRVRVLGVDGTVARMAGQPSGLLFFVDVENNTLVCVEPVDEMDSVKVRRHVRKVMASVGAE
jgi:transposase-like protein